MWMDQITDRLPGIIVRHNDICVYGKDTTEHNNKLLKLSQPQISFYGAIFTSQGMKLDPAKVQALQDLPTPQTPKQLWSFLGLVNYLQPFLPGNASKTTFLREQVSNWDWNPSTDQSFHCLKSWICNTLLSTTLAYYDHTQPLVLQTDASEYGLSAALIQNNRPTALLVRH